MQKRVGIRYTRNKIGPRAGCHEGVTMVVGVLGAFVELVFILFFVQHADRFGLDDIHSDFPS